MSTTSICSWARARGSLFLENCRRDYKKLQLKDKVLWGIYILLSVAECAKVRSYFTQGINISLHIENMLLNLIFNILLHVGLNKDKIIWAMPWFLISTIELLAFQIPQLRRLIPYEWIGSEGLIFISYLTFLVMKAIVLSRAMMLFVKLTFQKSH